MTAPAENGVAERHTARMARKKAVIDARIATAQDARGVLVVNTGNGKGKSSAAFGVVARALGHGQRVAVVQFVKGRTDTGEEAFFRAYAEREPGRLVWHVSGEGFTWETQDKSRDIAAAQRGWEKAKELIRDPDNRLVLLDEINIALRYDYLDIAEVVAFLRDEKPPMTHVVLTGRNARPELIELADLVTEMEVVKHPFRDGIKAQPGVEF